MTRQPFLRFFRNSRRSALRLAIVASLAVALLATPAQAHGPAPRLGYATSVAVSDVPPVRFVSALVERALRDLGRGNFTGTRGPWCAWAVSTWLRDIGLRQHIQIV